MNNLDSIDMAGTWKQEFLNKASRAELIANPADNGLHVAAYDPRPFDARQIPVLLLGNKYDLVSSVGNSFINRNLYLIIWKWA